MILKKKEKRLQPHHVHFDGVPHICPQNKLNNLGYSMGYKWWYCKTYNKVNNCVRLANLFIKGEIKSRFKIKINMSSGN